MKDKIEAYLMENHRIKGGKDFSLSYGVDRRYHGDDKKVFISPMGEAPFDAVVFADLSRKDVIELLADLESPCEGGIGMGRLEGFQPIFRKLESAAFDLKMSRQGRKACSEKNEDRVNPRAPRNYDGSGMGHW